MFASYEVATSFPSLTAIKGYDLDKSSDVPLMGHSISVFIGFQWFRLVLMVFHGSRLDFHGSRSVFMV